MTATEPTTGQISAALRRVLERIEAGHQAQLGPQAGGLSFAVLAGMLAERGLVRLVKRRDHTQTYTLTKDGKECLAGLRLHGGSL